jgi:broad specificity phosphatase PhoE
VFTHIFSSDLQRARKTAEAVLQAQVSQRQDAAQTLRIEQLAILREQDFGYYEGKPFIARPSLSSRSGKEKDREKRSGDPGFIEVESKDAMAHRMDSFMDEYLLPVLMRSGSTESIVAIVSHGIILSYLWKRLLKRFSAGSVRLASRLSAGEKPGPMLESLGRWSNTAFLDLEIRKHAPSSKMRKSKASSAMGPRKDAAVASTSARSASPSSSALMLRGWDMTVKSVNNKGHLAGLKRTKGGIGSSKHDSSQKTMDRFLKKQKT